MRALMQVTSWEFMRYFKWKQELVGLLVGLLIGALFTGGSAFVTWTKSRQRPVVLVMDPLGLAPRASDALVFESAPDRARAEAQVARGERAALLTLEGPDAARLLVAKDPAWQSDLEKALAAARQAWKLKERGMSPEQFRELQMGPALSIVRTTDGRPAVGLARKVAGIALLGFQLMAVMTCFGLFFTNLTGEKQNRVTEQVITAIPAQTWMDGKILAFSLHGLKGIATMVFWGVLALAGFMRFGGSRLLADLGAISPFAWLAALSFFFLGLLFWSAFYAGLAATIDDPNHSARTQVLLLPALPAGFSLMLMKYPDLWLAKVLSWLPVTSMGMMPLRVVQGSAGALEAFGSAALLLVSFLLLRRLAGRIFRTSMLMYGQEPTWANIWRMARAQD